MSQERIPLPQTRVPEAPRFLRAGLVAVLALLLLEGPAAAAEPPAPVPPRAGRGTPIENFLASEWDAVDKSLSGDRSFRGTPSAPAHEQAFLTYLKVVGRRVGENGDNDVRAAWKEVAEAAPEARGAAPAFPAVLRDYTSHRYLSDILDATGSLIRCRTFEVDGVAPAGSEPFVRARAIVDSLGKSHGFDVATRAGGLAMELTAGDGPDTLGLWGHLDVVPADSGWVFDPWSGRVVDGALQGRGAMDDKGPFVAALFAIRALRDTGVPLRSRFLLFGGFAEETTFDCINGYLKEAKPPSRNVVIDAAFPVVVGEKGTTWVRVSSCFKRIALRNCPEGYKIEEISGGVAANQVPAYARIRLWPVDRPASRAYYILKSRVTDWNVENSRSQLSARLDGNAVVVEALGRAAHGSTPELGHNAIIDLVEFTYELGSTCLQPSHYIVSFLNELIREDLSGRGLGIALKDSIMGRTTVNVGTIGSTYDSTWVVLDIRHPRGLSSNQVVNAIREHLAPFNARYSAGLFVERIGNGLEPIYTDPSNPLVKKLLAAYGDVYGVDGAPSSIGGTTYAKKLPGAVSFGPELPGEGARSHAANESIGVVEIDRLARVYATAAFNLAGNR